MDKRSYKITFDLKEGYSPKGRVHTLKFAGDIIREWLTARLQAGEPVITGFLQDGLLFFPAGDENITVNPSAVFSGELSTLEDAKRTDEEVRETLEALAKVLKAGLKQESVYLIYLDKNWCV